MEQWKYSETSLLPLLVVSEVRSVTVSLQLWGNVHSCHTRHCVHKFSRAILWYCIMINAFLKVFSKCQYVWDGMGAFTSECITLQNSEVWNNDAACI
jgi:hypothetical protein